VICSIFKLFLFFSILNFLLFVASFLFLKLFLIYELFSFLKRFLDVLPHIIGILIFQVHYSGEQGKYANELLAAQDRAQKAGLNMWKDWTPPKEEKVVLTNGKSTEVQSRTVNLKKIVITEVTNNMCFYGQYVENCQKLEELTGDMRRHFAENEPTPGTYKGEFSSAF